MLLEFRQKKLPYTELPIETVYIEDNQTSHFRPVRDSVRIYWLIVRHFLRFAGCSLLCFGLDLLLFALLSRYVFGSLPQAGQIFAATAAAVSVPPCAISGLIGGWFFIPAVLSGQRCGGTICCVSVSC